MPFFVWRGETMGKQYWKEFVKYAALNVLGMLGLSCYILADTFFIAQGLGSRGLAALNLALPVYTLVHGMGLMLGMGGATRFSMMKGQGREADGDKVFSQTIFLAAGFAVFFVLLGIFGSGTITTLFGADEAIYEMCKTYLGTVLLFAPAILLNDVTICFVRNDGAPQLAMAGMLCGSFGNIILDYVFIFPLGMGIFGAVFATCLAPIMSLLVMSPFFVKKRNTFHLRKCPMQMRVITYIFAGGVPSFVAEISSGIVIMVFNIIMLGLAGNTGVAAYGVIANLSLVVLAVYTGIAQGIQPLISSYYGKGEKEPIRKIYRYAIGSVVVLSAVIYLFMFLGAGPVAAVFNSENNLELQKIAVKGIRIYFTGCVFAGLNIVMSIYFTSTNRAKPANVISMLRGLVLIIPMAFLLSSLGQMTGLWMTFPTVELIVAIIGIFLYIREK